MKKFETIVQTINEDTDCNACTKGKNFDEHIIIKPLDTYICNHDIFLICDLVKKSDLMMFIGGLKKGTYILVF